MMHVLVVDDDPAIRELVQQTLTDEGYHVVGAANGREALVQIAAAPPAVVLLDMRMPVLDGWGVARALREQAVAVPLVVMTAAPDATAWAREVAAADALAKPFALDNLVAVVRRFVDCAASSDQAPSPAAGGIEPPLAAWLDALAREVVSPLSAVRVGVELLTDGWEDLDPELRADVLRRMTLSIDRAADGLAELRSVIRRHTRPPSADSADPASVSEEP